MKAVMLAAGKSTRTQPLTVTRPKPLLKVANKTIIEHNLDQISGLVDEVVIIVGFKKEMIMNHLGMKYKDLKLTFVFQDEQLGTGHAIKIAKDFIDDDFLMLCGDDFYSRKDIENLMKHKNAALVFERENPEQYGVFFIEGEKVVDFKEKPTGLDSGLCNTGCYVFEKNVLTLVESLEKSERGEYEFVDVFMKLVNEGRFEVEEVKDFWIPISYPWDLLEANSHFLENLKDDIEGKIEPNVTIHGNVELGEDSVIMSGVYIEGNVKIGKNCKIGPNAYIRGPTSIGDNCRVGPAEMKACVLFDGVRCDHVSYIGDSVLGEKAHIGAHTVTANLRHDGKNHRSMVKDSLIDTGRRKLGIIMGDHSDTSINTSFYPARKMWPYTFTEPCEIVKKDIIDRICELKKVKSEEK